MARVDKLLDMLVLKESSIIQEEPSQHLWLRYPDIYYIYKFRQVKALSDRLGSNYGDKREASTINIGRIRNFIMKLEM